MGGALTLIGKHIGEESTMSGDINGNLLGADESDWEDEETGFEDEEWLEETELDPTEDDLAVIGSMGSRNRPH